MPLIYPSTTGHVLRCNSNARCWISLTQSSMPRQSHVVSMSCLVSAWPSAKVGENIELKYRERLWKDTLGKKAVRKEYSKDALSISAVLKAWKGASR